MTELAIIIPVRPCPCCGKKPDFYEGDILLDKFYQHACKVSCWKCEEPRIKLDHKCIFDRTRNGLSLLPVDVCIVYIDDTTRTKALTQWNDNVEEIFEDAEIIREVPQYKPSKFLLWLLKSPLVFFVFWPLVGISWLLVGISFFLFLIMALRGIDN